MSDAHGDVQRLVEAVRRDITRWTPWPGGYSDEIDAALIDAVLSIRAKYGGKSTGVRAAVQRWREHRGDGDDLAVLALTPVGDLMTVLKNRQTTGRQPKAAAIVATAARLRDAGVRHARDLDPAKPEHRAAYVGVRGLGPITWTYFAMLLGHPGVKADTWILRYVVEVLEREVPAGEAEVLLGQVADVLGRGRTDLDHTVWQYMRGRGGLSR